MRVRLCAVGTRCDPRALRTWRRLGPRQDRAVVTRRRCPECVRPWGAGHRGRRWGRMPMLVREGSARGLQRSHGFGRKAISAILAGAADRSSMHRPAAGDGAWPSRLVGSLLPGEAPQLPGPPPYPHGCWPDHIRGSFARLPGELLETCEAPPALWSEGHCAIRPSSGTTMRAPPRFPLLPGP